MEADLVIAFKVFRERFGSRVTLWPGGRQDRHRISGRAVQIPEIAMELHRGPQGCRVDFWVDFEFRNRILQGVIGLVFNEAMQRVVRAFETRARALYG